MVPIIVDFMEKTEKLATKPNLRCNNSTHALDYNWIARVFETRNDEIDNEQITKKFIIEF